ncbi:Rwp-rk domain, partial [Globisporangium splendens]
MDQALHSLRVQLRARSRHLSTRDGSANCADSDGGNSDEKHKRESINGAKPRTDGDGDSMRVRREHNGSYRRGAGSRRRIHFEVNELQELYHLPLKSAAERLGICEAALKRICRRNHIKKWPYRHLQSIRRRMTHLGGQENAAPSNSQCQEEQTQDLSSKGKAKRRRSEVQCERPRAAFLLPHEKKRVQREHRERNNSKHEAAKSTMLRILEEEKERVINQAHRADATDVLEQVSEQQPTEIPGQRLNAVSALEHAA